MTERAAVGLRARTGSAVAVALAGSPSSPAVADRREIDLLDGSAFAQPYHVAGRDPEHADEIIGQTASTAGRLAERGLRALVDSLRADGCVVARAGLVLASGFAPTPRQALSHHPAMHAAEGELYRDAIARACERCGLEVVGLPEKEIPSRAASALGVGDLEDRLKAFGADLGPPWRREHKLAALAAWLALAGAEDGS